MTKLNHLIELILTLQYKELTTASELAQILEVNKKTVYRYIETLIESNIPVLTKKGRYGGFYLDQSFFMKQPGLERKEMEALMMAADILTNQKGFAYEKYLRSAVSKIKSAVLHEELELQDMKGQNDFSINGISGIEGLEDKIARINTAIARGRVLEISYYSVSRTSTSKLRVEAYTFFYKGGEWLLVGNCLPENRIVTLSLSRVKKARLTDEIYLKPANIELTKYISSSGEASDNKGREVRIRLARHLSDFINEIRWDSSHIISKEANGDIVLQMVTEQYDEIKRWVMGFGSEAEVLEPEFLREQIREEVHKLHSFYQSTAV